MNNQKPWRLYNGGLALFAFLTEGGRVKCGFRACGKDVATREGAYPGLWILYGFSGPMPADLRGVFVLSLLPGFVPDSKGTWRLSRHARNRIENGKLPQNRWNAKSKRKYLRDSLQRFDTHIKAGGREETFPIDAGPPMAKPRRVALPCVVVCPKCGRPQVLAADVLGVLPEALAHA